MEALKKHSNSAEGSTRRVNARARLRKALLPHSLDHPSAACLLLLDVVACCYRHTNLLVFFCGGANGIATLGSASRLSVGCACCLSSVSAQRDKEGTINRAGWAL